MRECFKKRGWLNSGTSPHHSCINLMQHVPLAEVGNTRSCTLDGPRARLPGTGAEPCTGAATKAERARCTDPHHLAGTDREPRRKARYGTLSAVRASLCPEERGRAERGQAYGQQDGPEGVPLTGGWSRRRGLGVQGGQGGTGHPRRNATLTPYMHDNGPSPENDTTLHRPHDTSSEEHPAQTARHQ